VRSIEKRQFTLRGVSSFGQVGHSMSWFDLVALPSWRSIENSIK
jgi:hypothetical protein